MPIMMEHLKEAIELMNKNMFKLEEIVRHELEVLTSRVSKLEGILDGVKTKFDSHEKDLNRHANVLLTQKKK